MEWRTHPTCCLQSLHSIDLKYDLASQQRKPIATEQWPSRCSSIRTDPTQQALHSKSKYMPLLNEIGTLLFYNQPNQHSSQPTRNHNTISRNDRDNNSSSKSEKRISSKFLKKNTIIHPPLQKKTDELKLSKPRMGGTRSKPEFFIGYYSDILSL